MATRIAVSADQSWAALPERNRVRDLLLVARRNPVGVFGLCIAVGYVVLVLFGPSIAP